MNITLKRPFIRVISYLSVAAIILTASTIYFAYRAKGYERQYKLSYEESLSELCEALDNITVSLQKSTYCGTKEKLMGVGNELTRQATSAKNALSRLTSEELISDEIFKFLSQIGAYTLSLAEGDGEYTLSDEDAKSLLALLSYSKRLSQALSEVLKEYDEGSVSIERVQSTLSLNASELPDSLSSRLIDAEESLSDYPTLIYDGPFSDNILNRKGGKCLSGLDEITRGEAKTKAAELLGVTEGSLRQDEDTSFSVPLYCFSKGDTSIGITKKGGLICYLLSPSNAGEETISEKQAVKRGKKYLSSLGYENMKDSYYSVYDGVCTINFAYVENDIIHYADLIKVSVALDSGEITCLDASDYLVNHQERDIYKESILEDEAIENLSSSLCVIGTSSAVIPLDTGKEAYCYEFHCKDKDGNEVLVYIDKGTGEERDILLLIYEDEGVLTR